MRQCATIIYSLILAHSIAFETRFLTSTLDLRWRWRLESIREEQHHQSTASEEQKESHQYVAKTIESFKLADLYLAEARVTANCNRNAPSDLLAATTVSDLAFHQGTASYLLGFTTSQVEPSILDLPFRARRIQYAARVLAAGVTVDDFIVAIKCHFDKSVEKNFTWVLDYDTFEPLSNDRQRGDFKPAMLMCAVSRLLHGEPTVTTERDDVEKADKYKIIETKNRLYLTKMMANPTNETRPRESHTLTEFKKKWARRPFQYSGAFNLEAAITVIDILGDLTVRKQGSVKLLDPTCGSGTFLALALQAWADSASVRVVGVDSNPKCSEGSFHNLQHAFDHSNRPDGNTFHLGTSSSATIHCADSSGLSNILGETFDCAVANLPWNRNTFELKDIDEIGSNERILESVSSLLSPGAPFVVVSGGMAGQDDDVDKQFNARSCLEKLGMTVLTTACIPPRGFNLPSSSKKKVRSAKNVARSSDCVITIAIR